MKIHRSILPVLVFLIGPVYSAKDVSLVKIIPNMRRLVASGVSAATVSAVVDTRSHTAPTFVPSALTFRGIILKKHQKEVCKKLEAEALKKLHEKMAGLPSLALRARVKGDTPFYRMPSAYDLVNQTLVDSFPVQENQSASIKYFKDIHSAIDDRVPSYTVYSHLESHSSLLKDIKLSHMLRSSVAKTLGTNLALYFLFVWG